MTSVADYEKEIERLEAMIMFQADVFSARDAHHQEVIKQHEAAAIMLVQQVAWFRGALSGGHGESPVVQ